MAQTLGTSRHPLLTGKEKSPSIKADLQIDLLQAMETFTQEHVIGIPLTSFAYADEERQGKSSCFDILSMIQIRRVPSFIG